MTGDVAVNDDVAEKKELPWLDHFRASATPATHHFLSSDTHPGSLGMVIPGGVQSFR
ncbi:MAG: hypothetical protein KDA81_10245 [Planctomycetaceae bacterium]|nr:hypothetical protein [Planctomycetaceae bacterium]